MSTDPAAEVERLLQRFRYLERAADGLRSPERDEVEVQLSEYKLRLSRLDLCLNPAKTPANSPAGFYKMPSRGEAQAKIHQIKEGLDKIDKKMATLPKRATTLFDEFGDALLLFVACIMQCHQLIDSCIADDEPDMDMTYEEAVMMQEDDKWSRDSD